MSKNPRKTERTRKQIVSAFWELYERDSIDRITVKEIVSKAGINRSTFYVYFDSVYDVLHSIEDELLAKFQEGPPNRPDIASFEEVLRHQAAHFEEEGRYIAVLMSEKGDPVFAHKMKEMLAERIAQEPSSCLTKDQIGYVNEFTQAGISSTMSKWLKDGRTIPLDELMFIIHVFMDASTKLISGETPFYTSTTHDEE